MREAHGERKYFLSAANIKLDLSERNFYMMTFGGHVLGILDHYTSRSHIDE